MLKYVIGFIFLAIIVAKIVSPESNPYTGGAEAAVRAVDQTIQQETRDGLSDAGALPDPRDMIDAAPSSGGGTQPTPGTTTKPEHQAPAWVRQENLGGRNFCWHASPAGAPKTPTLGKVGLKATIKGVGVVTLTDENAKNVRILYDTDGHYTLTNLGNKFPITPEDEKKIFAGASALGLEPKEGQKLSGAYITFSVPE